MMGLPSSINPKKQPHSLYEGIEYKDFWSGLQRCKLDELEHAIVNDLLPVSGYRIIDVGCGYGRLADCYMGRFQQVVMFDGSISLLRQAQEKIGERAIYIAGDVMHLPFKPSTFETILMIRVFHHIPDSKAHLTELHRIICDDGRFIFSYRNKRNALHTLRWLLGGKFENPFTKEPAGLGSTLISHNPDVVHQMLIETGFTDIRYYGAGVVDWFAGKLGIMGKWIPPGRILSRLLGATKIAPWILCEAITRENDRVGDTRGICDILQCPSCGGSVCEDGQRYLCCTCKMVYPIEDGIIDLRV